MEFRHLESFLAIAEELHFGRAAAKLHLAQPSLSQHLQRLERSVGTELVARTSHEVRLTPAGEAFRDQARAIVAQVYKAGQTAREAAAGRSGSVDVAYNFAAGQQVLPAVLTKMHAEHPNVGVTLHEMRTGPQLQALRAGDVDVAMVYGRPVGAEFESRPLAEFPLVAVVGPGHKWAGRPGASFSELAHEPCIMFGREQCPAMYDSIFGAASSSGISLNVEYEIDDPGAVAIMTSVKPLVGFASTLRGRHISGNVRAVPVRLYDPVPTVELYVAWLSGKTSSAADLFLDCVETQASVLGEEPLQV